MPETDIGSAATGDNTSTFKDFSVDPQTLDSAQDQKETEYMNNKWSQQLGYYKSIPELKAAIDTKARWTVGKGFGSNPITEMALSAIKGFGKDTFNSILENMIRVYQIGGDSYAEIIRDTEGNLINLKPLNPGTIKIIANRAGIIKRYEQTNRTSKSWARRVWGQVTGQGSFLKFNPEEIFHLCRDRIADEIHGVSLVDAAEKVILAYNEVISDYQKLLHRNIYPVRVWTLDTDDQIQITAFKAKVAEAKYKGEDIFIPKGAVETELASVPTNAILNPLAWITDRRQTFWKIVGCPEITVGGSQEFSESASKIALIAFEQVIAESQLEVEEQVLSQLNLEIELDPPVTIQNELISDNQKSETVQASTPEDTSVTNTEVTEGVPA